MSVRAWCAAWFLCHFYHRRTLCAVLAFHLLCNFITLHLPFVFITAAEIKT